MLEDETEGRPVAPIAGTAGLPHERGRRSRSRSPFTPLELARFWLRDYGLALGVVAALCALFAGLSAWSLSTTRGPERVEDAKVLRFGYYADKWVQRPLVIVRTSDGRVRELIADRRRLRDCHAGDSIMLVRRGPGLFVDRRGCRTPAVAPQAKF